MPGEVNPDTNFKVIDKRSPETQARVAEMTRDHIGDVNEMVLKPCPMCGGEAEIVLFKGMNESLVQCKECELQTTMFHGLGGKCVAAWNRRTPEPGTSVVRWVRYDGTQETLPKEGRDILTLEDGEMFCARRIGRQWTSATYADDPDCDSYISVFFAVGDLWAYPPEPVEGMR